MDYLSIYKHGVFIDNKYGLVVHAMKHDDNYYYNIIRNNIKKYRKIEGLTQQQLADKAEVTMNYIAKIESEKMQRGFTIVVLGRIADALNIDIRCLFDDMKEESSK